jgi:Protein of unknown function (DUF2505)
VRFCVEHEFPGSPSAVTEILCDPEFHTRLDLPDLSRPEVVERSVAGSDRILRLRYEYVGRLDPIARRLLAGRRLTWIQELRLDPSGGGGRLSFAAEEEADRLHGAADITLVALEAARTRRRVVGDFVVRVPLLGSTAERRIVPGLVRRLDVEAEAVCAVLNGAR